MKYLINLDAKEICVKGGTTEELNAIGEKATWAYHIVDSETFTACTLHDLINYYNNLPATTEKIKVFRDRATAMRRINEAIERGGVCEPRTGKKAVKPRKKRSDGSTAGRRAAWETICISAAGKSEEVTFHKKNPRFQVYEVIKRREEVSREDLVKFCEESLGIKRPQVMGAVGKLLFRGLIKVK